MSSPHTRAATCSFSSLALSSRHPNDRPTSSSTSLPSLPPPFCPPVSPPPALAHLRHQWIRHNAPVLLQPTIDIRHGNPLLAAFYHFTPDNSTVILSLVYEGEASYEVNRPTVVNRFGSFCYRTHNYRTFCRTADINHIAYHHCTLQRQRDSEVGEEGGRVGAVHSEAGGAVGSSTADWQVLHTTDFSGLQSWSKGNKGRLLYFYSLMHHYDLELRTHQWRQWDDHWTTHQQQQQLQQWQHGDLLHHTSNTAVHDRLHESNCTAATQRPTAHTHYRPVVYVNTGNHTMAPFNTNPSTFPPSAYTAHTNYPLYPGDRSVAERFGQLAVRGKWTVYSFVPVWLYVPGGGEMESERRVWRRRMHHSVLLEGRVEEVRRRRDEEEEGKETERMKVEDGSGHVIAVVESMDNNAAIEHNADKI